MPTLVPIRDKVVVKLDETKDVSDGGILLPDQVQKKPARGEIVAVGEGKPLDNGQILPMTVKVGDRILFSKYGGTEIEVDGEDFTILDEDQIYAIVKAS